MRLCVNVILVKETITFYHYITCYPVLLQLHADPRDLLQHHELGPRDGLVEQRHPAAAGLHRQHHRHAALLPTSADQGQEEGEEGEEISRKIILFRILNCSFLSIYLI